MNLDAARQRFRAELGLPADGRLVMTGHQCSIWHAGILAKYLACDALIPNQFDHAAWLWVDQDTDETHTLRVPVTENGTLNAAAWALKRPSAGDIAACNAPAFAPAPFAGQPALAQVRDGVERISASLAAHQAEQNAARQCAAALTELMAPLVAERPAVFASGFMGTSLGALLVERMLADPRGCARAYNRAAAGTPAARVLPLADPEREDDVELPLWLLAPGAPRVRVTARRLREHTRPGGGAPAGTIPAPRALLMTGMARLAACDLFIHGTGGGIYDTITERWFKEWLDAELAPTRVVTADLYLPLPAPQISEREARHARWRAAHARHDPSMLGDAAAAAEKARLLALIHAAKASGERPLPHYRAMHEALAKARERHRPELEALDTTALAAEAALAQSQLARDRTWAFPFHTHDALRTLKESVTGLF